MAAPEMPPGGPGPGVDPGDDGKGPPGGEAPPAVLTEKTLTYRVVRQTVSTTLRTLFRARIPVPAAVPPGLYRAEVYLFQGGTVVSAQSSPLFIDKTGFERRLYDFTSMLIQAGVLKAKPGK